MKYMGAYLGVDTTWNTTVVTLYEINCGCTPPVYVYIMCVHLCLEVLTYSLLEYTVSLYNIGYCIHYPTHHPGFYITIL